MKANRGARVLLRMTRFASWTLFLAAVRTALGHVNLRLALYLPLSMIVLNRIVLFATAATLVIGQQIVFDSSQDPDSPWTTFPHPISRVAVIGAGPAGLQAAAHLIAANLTVRLFERAPAPGGNWFYTKDTPARETYPGVPLKETEPLPEDLPATIYYEEGDGGIRLEDRWKQHWQPRPVWYDLHTNTPAAIHKLPGINYPPNIPWSVSVHDVQRHVRAYASLHGLNSNDESESSAPITSYSTVVEKVQKRNSTAWTLTLRRLERLHESNRIKADLWTEDFDAVVVAAGPCTTPHVPAIEGIGNWSVATLDGRYPMQHSQSYRHPERYSGKTVLIVGASVSADIARSIAPFVRRLIISVRPSPARRAYGFDILLRFPEKTELIPEISSFDPLDGFDQGIKNGKIRLANGTVLEGVDEIILATGYRPNTFLPDLVDPLKLDNLHWTGHYIHDPTLAYAYAARPWTHGKYQSYGFAKVWTGTARLPSRKQMWQDHQAGKYKFGVAIDILPQEALARQYIAWLNSESLELGGPLVEPLPAEAREIFTYFVNAHWGHNFLSYDDYTRFDNLPASEWPKPGPPSLQYNMLSEW
ncbi:FAD/NAD-P-binding domain-containing protein [Mycena latifolia]|nr:FAD/NAD-P-binding domain-containing protein [Mycena latifolia]